MGFTGSITAKIAWAVTDSNDGSITDTGSYPTLTSANTRQLADGVDIDQAETIYRDIDLDITSAASATYDLTALSKTIFGETAAQSPWTSLRSYLVKNDADSVGDLVFDDGAGNSVDQFPAITIPPGGQLLFDNPEGVVIDSTNSEISLTASGGDVTASVILIGTTSALAGSGSSSASSS